MSTMKAMGVNALRTAHNPPAPELVEVCEELGIVMMVEAFDTWRNHKVAFDYATWFALPAPGAAGLLWSDLDIMTMVNTFKNSPAVIMWSIGNEIRGQTVEDATRLVADIKSIDASRPVVWGSDSYRSPPSPGSVNGRIALLLDGIGLNYNTAQSVDALHALYPTKFIFESESSSSTSSRGNYQWPQQLNTGEDYTPGHRLLSSYDNNMASWTMPGEYGLKKDRDRQSSPASSCGRASTTSASRRRTISFRSSPRSSAQWTRLGSPKICSMRSPASGRPRRWSTSCP